MEIYPNTLKVIVLGSSGVGKSAIIERLLTDDFKQSCKPTISANFVTKELIFDNKKVSIQL